MGAAFWVVRLLRSMAMGEKQVSRMFRISATNRLNDVRWYILQRSHASRRWPAANTVAMGPLLPEKTPACQRDAQRACVRC